MTLGILKSLENGDKINIYKIVTGDATINIPSTVIQYGPSSNIETFDEKIYFNRMSTVYVHYYSEDGQSHKTSLQNLKQVNFLHFIPVHYILCSAHY